MQLIARILLILAAAGAVVGVTMGWAGTAAGARGDGPRREAPAQVQAGEANALPGNASSERRRGDGPGGFEHGGGRSPSLFGAGEMLKDLVIIALLVAVVAPLARLLNRRLRSDSENQPNAEPPAISSPL